MILLATVYYKPDGADWNSTKQDSAITNPTAYSMQENIFETYLFEYIVRHFEETVFSYFLNKV